MKAQSKGDLTLALISPSFVFTGMPSSSVENSYGKWLLKRDVSPEAGDFVDRLVKSYLGALQSDFEKVMITDGFRTLGPFSNREIMTYPQRELAELALESRVFIDLFDDVTSTEQPASVEVVKKGTPTSSAKKQPPIFGGDDAYAYSVGPREKEIHPGTVTGTLSIGARIELSLYEPLTWEKMWMKTISVSIGKIEPYSYKYIDYKGERVIGEDGRPSILDSVLVQSYSQILGQFQTFFDPKEIETINSKAKEIREKKVFLVK
jgi:hypothetical protein